ncbi:MAG: glycosyltransferase family 4 protein [Eubacterium sp.]|nr:glycosyltransferase family 4 protein [Eubacterium sp.]
MKKIMVMVNRDFVLYNFRIELVERLLEENYKVYICLPYGEKVDKMVAMGCKFVPVEIDKRGKNPFRDLKLIRSYWNILKRIQPDLILMYTTKVNIYAGILAGRMNIPYLMNVSGLGTALEYKSMVQKLMIFLYKRAARHAKCLFFQNLENQAFFEKHGMYDGMQKLIPGSGVNLKHWHLMEYPDDAGGVEFLFIARVIKEKGIEEYLAMAKQIKTEYPNTVFHVLGPCDGEYEDMLCEYERKGIIRYHGMVQDTREFLMHAHCTVHPSYYPEGVSNVLLESAACGRPVITTDRSGCRETVEDGVTGFVVAQKDMDALIGGVRKFMQMGNDERRKMGLAGREKMVREFDREIVVGEYMEEVKNGL